MIILAGTLTVPADRLEEALATCLPMIEASRAEVGCLEYVFSADPVEPGTLRLFECWTDADALAAHGVTEHMRAFRSRMDEIGILNRSIVEYEVAEARPR